MPLSKNWQLGNREEPADTTRICLPANLGICVSQWKKYDFPTTGIFSAQTTALFMFLSMDTVFFFTFE